MFDNIKCELPLPLNKKEQAKFSNVNWSDKVYQTKDTDCTLSHYTIRKNGKLYAQITDGELIRVISEKEEKKIKAQGRFCWPFEYKVNSVKYRLEKFTGNLYFYDSVIDKNGDEWWVEFFAKFNDGVLQGKIKKVKVEFSQSADEIKKNNENFKKVMDDYWKNPWNKTKIFLNKITFNRWRKFWLSVEKFLNFIIHVLGNLKWWIARNMW